ncbi:DNA-directed RNA polymerase [Giardia muris]|uniref:DNA-directed RNA polymerase subunit n=1 Tax=Giardia muris TaxID=5742 RepID=A0A4Z1SLM4_GIAMU|nr:DNA-directed RNA polymerase [Giardia muris]|eukprot:TNJ26552.1 DNA-directed RNA polymerase [Giardia muris]
MNTAPIAAQLGPATFSMYTPADARMLAVCRITSAQALDHFGNVLQEGYYDPAMGPIGFNDVCTTCNQSWRYCPGHAGAIELPFPMFNVLHFSLVLKLIRAVCHSCHRLYLSDYQVILLETALLLIDAGRLEEAADLHRHLASGAAHISPEHLAELRNLAFEHLAEKPPIPLTSQLSQERYALVQCIFSKSRQRCPHCKALNIKFNGHQSLYITRVLDDGPAIYWPRDILQTIQKVVNTYPGLFSLLFGRPTYAKGSAFISRPGKLAGGYDRNDVQYRDYVAESGLDLPFPTYREPFSPDALFISTLLIPPNRQRPPVSFNDVMCDHPINVVIRDIIEAITEIRSLVSESRVDSALAQSAGKSGQLTTACRNLQRFLNIFIDGSTQRGTNKISTGIRQLLEKKAGLFRTNMMGKRGNYSGRSVIAPDANLNTNEIGIPDYFASRLTFPEPVCEYNVELLAQLVVNGPNYPGAAAVVDENGQTTYLEYLSIAERRSLADTLLIDVAGGDENQVRARLDQHGTRTVFRGLFRHPKVVHRHTLPGDYLFLNRQPTLHKHSIVGLRARILPGNARVIRFHFASCKGLNADFDGDECGVTKPQTFESAAEYGKLIDGDTQYTSVTSGEPIRGLIQDHIIGGIFLCAPGVFLGSGSFMQHVAVGCGITPRGESRELMLIGINALMNQNTTENPFSALPEYKYVGTAVQHVVHHPRRVTWAGPAPKTTVRSIIPRPFTQDYCPRRVSYSDTSASASSLANQRVSITTTHLDQKVTVVYDSSDHDAITIPQPTVVYPIPQWTGKAVVTTMLRYMARGRHFLNYTGSTKMPTDAWGPHAATESRVIIVDGELLTGFVDKQHISTAPRGLAHAIYELYGHETCGWFLSNYGRLATFVLQHRGFTCSLEDMLLSTQALQKRLQIYEYVLARGPTATAAFLHEYLSAAGLLSSLPEEDVAFLSKCNKAEVLSHEERQRLYGIFRASLSLDLTIDQRLDRTLSDEANKITSQLIKACCPGELILELHSARASCSTNGHLSDSIAGMSIRESYAERTRFRNTFVQRPFNSLAYMILSGARGSTVNLQMMTTCLGQQNLEGRRVPTTLTGKTLPSHIPYEHCGLLQGGFIYDCFLTGIRPSSFFFHCQAGREGLIDTAVKTAISGYLQRVLIKNLEGLSIAYDGTVRNSDGGIIQLLYGGDGIDTTKTSYLTQFDFVRQNAELYFNRFLPDLAYKGSDPIRQHAGERSRNFVETLHHGVVQNIRKYTKRYESYLKDGLLGNAEVVEPTQKERRSLASILACIYGGNPADYEGATGKEYYAYYRQFKELPASFLVSPYTHLGSTSTNFMSALREYLTKFSEDMSLFELIANFRYLEALAPPGTPAGIIAAQSTGEPSTQLTLNTFHLAGHGGVNATMGVPRLRELIMTNSQHTRTPVMTIPFRQRVKSRQAPNKELRDIPIDAAQTRSEAEKIVRTLRPLFFRDVATKVSLAEFISEQDNAVIYDVTISFVPVKALVETHLLRGDELADLVCRVLIRRIARALSKEVQQQRQRIESVRASTRLPEITEQAGVEKTNESQEPSEASRDSSSEQMNASSTSSAQSSEEDEDDDSETEEEEDEHPEVDDSELRIDLEQISETTRSFIDTWFVHEDVNIPSLGTPLVAVESIQLTLSSAANPTSRCPRARFRLKVVNEQQILALAVIDSTISSFALKQMGQIRRCFLRTEHTGQPFVDVEGDGLRSLYLLPSILIDFDKLYLNNVWGIYELYGIEAARNALLREVSRAFDAYHITVDERHLSILADYMTTSGVIRGMNRNELRKSSEELIKATFEAACSSLTSGALLGGRDSLTNPSGAACAGIMPRQGTGAFDLRYRCE